MLNFFDKHPESVPFNCIIHYHRFVLFPNLSLIIFFSFTRSKKLKLKLVVQAIIVFIREACVLIEIMSLFLCYSKKLRALKPFQLAMMKSRVRGGPRHPDSNNLEYDNVEPEDGYTLPVDD